MPPADGEMPDETEGVDEIQNEIIKHNLEAMKSLHAEIEGLNGISVALNAKLDQLTSEVEEVREPSNTEKLMNKKNVSYPYYFNLNDMWSGSSFSERRDGESGGGVETEKGIRELPDGTYVADFDDLPQKSQIDVQNSFNEV
jgi:hypothetical protein